jgi:hypothetical protein
MGDTAAQDAAVQPAPPRIHQHHRAGWTDESYNIQPQILKQRAAGAVAPRAAAARWCWGAWRRGPNQGAVQCMWSLLQGAGTTAACGSRCARGLGFTWCWGGGVPGCAVCRMCAAAAASPFAYHGGAVRNTFDGGSRLGGISSLFLRRSKRCARRAVCACVQQKGRHLKAYGMHACKCITWWQRTLCHSPSEAGRSRLGGHGQKRVAPPLAGGPAPRSPLSHQQKPGSRGTAARAAACRLASAAGPELAAGGGAGAAASGIPAARRGRPSYVHAATPPWAKQGAGALTGGGHTSVPALLPVAAEADESESAQARARAPLWAASSWGPKCLDGARRRRRARACPAHSWLCGRARAAAAARLSDSSPEQSWRWSGGPVCPRRAS